MVFNPRLSPFRCLTQYGRFTEPGPRSELRGHSCGDRVKLRARCRKNRHLYDSAGGFGAGAAL